MVFYEKDIESMGGGVLLEKIIKKGITKDLYQGIMCLKGRRYRIHIYVYRKGKGKIISIALPRDGVMELDFLRSAYTKAIQNNEGELQSIIQKRKITKLLCNTCNALQTYLIITNLYRCLMNGETVWNLIIIISCILMLPINLIIKDRVLRF